MSDHRPADAAAALFWASARQGPKSALRAVIHLLSAPSPLVSFGAANALRAGGAGKLAKVVAGRLGGRGWDVALHRGEETAPRTAARRVLLVSHELTPSGAPKVVVEMAAAFRKLDYEVLVVSGGDGAFRDTLHALGASVIVDRDVLRGGGVAAALGRGFDLAICNTVVSDRLVERISRFCPCIWYIHEVSLLERKLGEASVRRALESAHAVWTGSEIPAALVRPLRPDVEIVPYGLEPAPRGTPAGAGPGSLKIGVFGSIESRKGQDLALAAFARLSRADAGGVELKVFGRVLEERFGEEVFETISQLSNAAYGGALDYEAYLTQLSQMDAVLISSRDDTLPLVSLDALSSGRVLLTSTKVGTSTYIADGVSGFVASDATAEALAEMLERALALRPKWSEIGEAGRAVFSARFSKAAFHARLATALHEVCAGGSSPTAALAQARA